MFPDTDVLARKVALQGLAEHGVTGIKVATELPSSIPARFIRLYTVPGREISRRTQWCQVIGQVYDAKGEDERCNYTARLLGAVLRAAPDMVVDGDQPINLAGEMHGPFPTEDPDLPGLPRYQVNLTWTMQSQVIPSPSS